MINQIGNIIEGTFTPDGKRNGFCITYNGIQNEIYVGWYKNDVKTGNWMSLGAEDFSVKEKGYYEDGRYVGYKRDHKEYKYFMARNVFMYEQSS